MIARNASSSPACQSASNLVTVLGVNSDSKTPKSGHVELKEIKVTAPGNYVNRWIGTYRSGVGQQKLFFSGPILWVISL
jgi:hypothetical protein